VQNTKAEVLSVLDILGYGGTDSIQNTVNFTIGNAEPADPIVYSNPLTLQLNASDLGQTLTISPTEDTTFFSNLTNGTYDLIGLEIGSSGYDLPEATFFSSYPAGWNGIDFQGFTIENLSLTINSITFDSGSNPFHNGQWTDYFYNMTLDVNGEVVPEPSSWVMVIIGVGFLGFLVPKCNLETSGNEGERLH
jgi:hypothetical protein